MSDPLIAALVALCEREGGFAEVAKRSGHGAHSIYEIVSGVKLPSGKPKGVGRRLRERLDRTFPNWLEPHWTNQHPPSVGPGTQGRGPLVAQELSQAIYRIDPITIAWEQILANPLPARFRLRVLDDSMALDDPPSMRTGDWAEFVPASTAAPNQVALVTDKLGNLYIRRVAQKRPGHWTALSRHTGYAPLDSIDDGLQVLAVQVGAGWG